MTAPNDPDAGADSPEPTASSPRIIRRAPTGPLPTIADTRTAHIPPQGSPGQNATRAVPQVHVPSPPTDEPSGRTAVAAAAVTIVSGWGTSVVATDLIAGWWRTDRLFCIAVGFLALVFAVATISGVILLLQHRPIGRYLIVAGAVVAMLTYGGVFLAGAHVAWIVYTLWVLPVASVVLALHPQTKRWLQG
ncbi:MAG: hypothetical protein ABSD32_19450 [Mycobacterium sp.]